MPIEMPEAQAKTKAYEAMFLLSQGVAADLTSAIEMIQAILDKSDATVIAMRKWDERRLAYEIDKQKRGFYLLIYFTGLNDVVSRIEHEVNLTEDIMRVLITTADHLTDEEIAHHDERDALLAEARMRSERTPETEEKSGTGVRLGAPEPVSIPQPEAPQEAAPAEAAPEGDDQGAPEPGEAQDTPEG